MRIQQLQAYFGHSGRGRRGPLRLSGCAARTPLGCLRTRERIVSRERFAEPCPLLPWGRRWLEGRRRLRELTRLPLLLLRLPLLLPLQKLLLRLLRLRLQLLLRLLLLLPLLLLPLLLLLLLLLLPLLLLLLLHPQALLL